MKNILHIEATNFHDFPLGGTLSFANQFIENISANFFLVGFGDENEPIGEWYTKKINGNNYSFYSIGYTSKVKRSKLPKRIIAYILLKKHIKNIHKNAHKFDVIFSQTPQFVFEISKYDWQKTIFCFAGLGNSVGNSKYKYLRFLGGIYEKILFKRLKENFNHILAAADENTIREKELKFQLPPQSITSFPTRFSPEIYYPKSVENCRKLIQEDLKVNLIVTVGRLSYIKGWKDLILSFRILLISKPNSKLIFIGDGEDKNEIIDFTKDEIKSGKISLVGRKKPEEVALYLNAANLFVMFSYIEGWPTAMTEALACGKNIVSTNIGGSYQMIKEGENGYIIKNRDIDSFSNAMLKSLSLPSPNPISLELSNQYSSNNLNSAFYKIIEK